MKIKLRLFASIRETMGFSEQWLDLPEQIQTVGDCCSYLCTQDAQWQIILHAQTPVKKAFEFRFASDDTLLHEGGELALFPPVTGG